MDWRETRVSAERTHHTLGGEPLYKARFLEVLKFHAPGLAPALGEDGALHIDLQGRPAYDRRFARTFGYYEGLAAVDTGEGWLHIHPDGSAAYTARYAWCGNFQGGACPVRAAGGEYHHIDRTGAALYTERWAYAGDYRDGVAVVQAADGLSTHIDARGRQLHGRWFRDLDVFHKGFARARDRQGWTHIDEAGLPIYARRFAAVEPFYNGQARVERFDGALEVIDERGEMLAELRPPGRSEFASLSRDLVGFWRTRTIATAVELGVFEALPGSPAALAGRLGLTVDGASRLLRALSELELVEPADLDEWRPTARGAFLRQDHPWSLAAAALEYAGPMDTRWRALLEALCVEGWRPPDIFAQVAEDLDRARTHHQMLQSYARHDYPQVVSAMTLDGVERVLDAGGGLGVLACSVARARPEVEVIVLERPEVAAAFRPPPELQERVRARSTDLFEPWGVRGDAVVLARVLHDWDDEQALTILTHAREALPPGGAVYLVELVVDEGGAGGALCDLHLMAMTGGRERTQAEFSELLGRAGFSLQAVERLPSVVSVLRGVAL